MFFREFLLSAEVGEQLTTGNVGHQEVQVRVPGAGGEKAGGQRSGEVISPVSSRPPPRFLTPEAKRAANELEAIQKVSTTAQWSTLTTTKKRNKIKTPM